MGRAHEVRAASMAKTAAMKSKLYSIYAKEIYQVAKTGGTDPNGNLALRSLIEKAKKEAEKLERILYGLYQKYQRRVERAFYEL